jgi:hypothetical protein
MQAMDPQNALERSLVDDVVALTWEIARAQRQKTDLINMTWREATRALLEALLTGDPLARRLEAQERANAYFTHAGKVWVTDFLAKYGLTIDAIAAQATAMRLPELEIIDRQAQRARVSRMALARDYTYHRAAGSWTSPKELLAIVDDKADAISLVPASEPVAGETSEPVAGEK